MRALVWHGPGSMSVDELPDPEPAPGEVLMRPEAVGICGSDLEGYTGAQANRRPPLVMAASLGIVDYVSRLVADVLIVGYVRDSARWTESRLYVTVVWGMVLFGCAVLLAGFDQPLTLVVLAAALSGAVMFVYAGLLIAINRRFLPAPLKIRGVRLAALVWAFGLFGVLTVIVAIDQFGELFSMTRILPRLLIALIAWAALVGCSPCSA